MSASVSRLRGYVSSVLWLILLGVLGSIAAENHAYAGDDFNVLIIGDSFAAGIEPNDPGGVPQRASYRPGLYTKLNNDVPSTIDDVNFVGPNWYNPGGNFYAHASIRGAQIYQFTTTYGVDPVDSSKFEYWLQGNNQKSLYGWANFTVDAVIVQVGLNNVFGQCVDNNSNTWTVADHVKILTRLNTLINGDSATDGVLDYYSNAHVFLCNITNVDKLTYTQAQNDLVNGAIVDLKASIPLNFANSQVTIVDINGAVNPLYDLVADGVHPNSSGEAAITDRLWSAMKNYYNW